MEILLLSAVNRNVAGILKLTSEEVAVYDPITGHKKYRAAGVEITDELIIPNNTSVERNARKLSVGSLVYDVTTKQLYIGDGNTYGGVPFETDLNLDPGQITSHEARIAMAENNIALLSSRISEMNITVSGEISTIVQQQLTFFNSEGLLNIGSIHCGDWVQAGYFPVDWKFGDWGHFGTMLYFDAWDTTVPADPSASETVETIIDQSLDIIGV